VCVPAVLEDLDVLRHNNQMCPGNPNAQWMNELCCCGGAHSLPNLLVCPQISSWQRFPRIFQDNVREPHIICPKNYCSFWVNSKPKMLNVRCIHHTMKPIDSSSVHWHIEDASESCQGGCLESMIDVSYMCRERESLSR